MDYNLSILYMLSCLLCQAETCYVSNFCPDCETIKRIVNVYGKLEVKEILETVCLRTKKQQKYKIDGIIKTKNELNKEIKELKKI